MSIKAGIGEYITEALQNHGSAFAIFTIGLVVGIAVKQWLIDNNYRNSIKERLSDKDQTINDLKQIIHERVVKIKVDQDKSFYKRVIRYFKRTA